MLLHIISSCFSFLEKKKRKDRVSLASMTELCFFFFFFFPPALLVPIATSATAVVTAAGTSSCLAPRRHFLGLSLFPLPVFPLFCRSFSSSFYLLPFFPCRSSKCRSLPLISFSLCLSLSLS